MMKDMIKQNVARNMADKEQIRLYAKSPSGESRMHLKIRMIIIMVCILLFCIGLGIFLILRQSRNRNGTRYSSATIFSDGQLLYFPNEKNTGLYSYDTESKEIKAVINETVCEFYAGDDYYFYSSNRGFYCKDRKTSEKHTILEYGKEVPNRLKELNGYPLLDTPAKEYSNCFFEYHGSVYFVYRIQIDLMPDKHTTSGWENWVTLYQYDTKTRSLTEIKRDHHISGNIATPNPSKGDPDYNANESAAIAYKDISITNVSIQEDTIYYANSSAVHRLSLDGKQDDILYRSDGRIVRLDWMDGGFHCIEQLEKDFSAPIEGERKTDYFFNTMDLNGEKTSSYKMLPDDYDLLDSASLYYDYPSDVYFALRKDACIRFSFDNPEDYTILATVQRTKEQNMFHIIMANQSVFIAAYDGVAGRDKHCYLMNINDQNELMTIIENGKAVL